MLKQVPATPDQLAYKQWIARTPPKGYHRANQLKSYLSTSLLKTDPKLYTATD